MKPWLQLFRAPNLFTVPGDPLAGYLLAAGLAATFPPALFLVIAASLLLYCYGLVLNDLMDYREDLRDRPGRPLPSGAIGRHAAIVAAVILAATALFLCWLAFQRLVPAPGAPGTFVFACALFLAITAYNCGLKKIPVGGVINMGACRGLNVLLGAALAGAFPPRAIAAASIIAIYITAVSLLARRETENPAIPPLIGKLIRALILIQAAFCAVAGGVAGWVCAAILALALWPLSRIVGGRFYGS